MTTLGVAFGADDANQVCSEAIEFGIFDSMTTVLKGSSYETKTKALFGLSNLTSEIPFCHAFLENMVLINHVIAFASHTDHKLKCEALWVLSNTITTAEPENLFALFNKHINDLIFPIIECFKVHETIHKSLL